jgi:hypothetical protein
MLDLTAALLVLAAVSWSSAGAAEPTGTLELACEGTTTTSIDRQVDLKPEPISVSIVVNFLTRTVHGFGTPALFNYPVKITGMDEVTITFSGSASTLTSVRSSTWALLGASWRGRHNAGETTSYTASITT